MTTVDPAGEARMTDQTTRETTQPTPTVEGSGEPYYRAIHDPRCDWRNAAGSEKPPCNCDELVPSPTAARGVTGLPTLAAVIEEVEHYGRVAGGRPLEAELAKNDLLATLRLLLSAAEQGERDREDTARLDWLEADMRGSPSITRVNLSDGSTDFRAMRGGRLVAETSRLRAAIDAARQPRQEGDR